MMPKSVSLWAKLKVCKNQGKWLLIHPQDFHWKKILIMVLRIPKHKNSLRIFKFLQSKRIHPWSSESTNESSVLSSHTYVKPYCHRIEQLRMPLGFQPPIFLKFNGKGNPRQHIAHFMEICSNISTKGDFLVKQLVLSLKGNAFDWYIDLKPSFIDSWEQLEREFLNRFYSTWCVVSMIELTNTC